MSSSTSDSLKAQRLLIFGATGLIGSHITRGIISGKQHFSQISVFTSRGTVERKQAAIDALHAQGVHVITGDIENEEDVARAYEGIDTVISCVGRNMIAAQTMLIRLAAESQSVRWFFPSEYGTDIEHNDKSPGEPPHQKKLLVRAAMAEVAKQGKLSYTYVVTGPYGDGDAGLYLSSNLAAEWAGSFNVKKKTAVLLGDGNLKIGLTMMKDVGSLVLAALLHPHESRNRAIKVNSFFTTDHAILAEFEKQTGGQPWQVSYTPLDELRRKEKEAWESGNSLATLMTLRRIWAEGGTLYERTDNDLIGMGEGKMTSLQEAVADAIKVQLEGSQVVERKLT